MSTTEKDGIARMRGACLTPTGVELALAPEWWERLADAVSQLARRYPRTFGSTIPKSWHDDAETVELLALICRWRAELDHQESAGRDGAPLDDLLFPETGIEHARHAWEWHAHRDHWLARLAETGIAPISAGGV